MVNAEVGQFGGLQLLADPQDVGMRGATSMLNADIGRGRSIVGSRAGLSRLGTGSGTYHRIAAVNGAKLVVAKNAGSGIAAQYITISSGSFSTASSPTWGSSSTIVTSILGFSASGTIGIASRNSSSNEELKAWDGTGAAPTGATYNPRYIAITPTDQRLVAAHYTSSTATPSGANGTTSTVFFSNAGDLSGIPASFPANNWVQLYPYDGEEITGVVTWRELTFVIKRSALYVFYGNSVDGQGNAVFNFRRVTLPALARATANRGGENMVAGPDGVYLLLTDGVYRTTGGQPEMLSRQISPLFDSTGDSAMVFPNTSTDWMFGSHGNRVYLSYPNGANYRTLVYDSLLGEWLLWDITAGTSALPTNVITWLDTNGLPVGYFAAGSKVFSFSPTATSDDGTAITSSYRTGFWTPAVGTVRASDDQRQVRCWKLDGVGAVSLKTAMNDSTTLGSAATVTMGTSPAVARGQDWRGVVGRNFSVELSSTAAWSVSRMLAGVE
jgi:hypothetical protein